MPEDEEQVALTGVAGAAPCGACRTLRRRCAPGCVFAPYFTAEDFAAAHSVFGASNVSKMLERVERPEQRRFAAATIVEEARARARDPTFGCISYLRILQEVNDKARQQVDDVREEIAREFGALAASQPVDVAAAAPAVRVEARAQVDAALKHAREQDARLLGVRRANEVRWRALHEEATGTGKHAGNGKRPDVIKRHRGQSFSEKTMLMSRAAKQRRSSPRPPGFPDERSLQQMAVADAEREKALLMRQQAAPAKQDGETEPPPRVSGGYGHGQLHQQMSEASREEDAMRSVQAPAAAPQQHLDSAGQHAGQRRHAGDDAAGRTPGQGNTSVLLEAMMQLAGAGDEQHQQQHHMPQHAQIEVDISQEMLKLQELLDMTELARRQQIMKNHGVMSEMGQWDAAAGVAMEQDVMTTMQQMQIPANTWQHQDPAPQYAGMRDGPQDQEMPQQMEEASTTSSELAKTTGRNMSQQFAWAQQYHDPAVAVHHASPWHHQMAEAHQSAAASASQVADEQDMLVLLQQHQVAAAAELLSAGGAHQFDNQLAAQYDDTELTLGYCHPNMHQLVPAAGHVAGVQDMNSRHAAAPVLAEQEMMQLDVGGQHHYQQQQHAQNGLDIAHGNGHPDGETQAMLQDLASILELADERAMMRKQLEQDVRTKLAQQDPDVLWLQEMLLEQNEKASTPDLDKRLQAEARHAQKELGITPGNGGHPDGSTTQENLQSQESFAMAERERKLEMLMRQFAAAERAREQELIAQQAAAAQHHPVAQYSEKERKLEMLMRQFAAAGRATEQEMITQQAAAVQHQQTVARYSGTELDISPGQGNGHQYWHQPTVQVQQMLQEQLADALGFGRHQPNTNLAQQVANGKLGSGAGAGVTLAFVSTGSAKDPPFLADQQPQSNGHQMDSSLPPSMTQLHAQVSHQQRTDGGGQSLNSDLTAYLHYDSLSRHGLAGNGRPQQ